MHSRNMYGPVHRSVKTKGVMPETLSMVKTNGILPAPITRFFA
jgi:hypothetical protein